MRKFTIASIENENASKTRSLDFDVKVEEIDVMEQVDNKSIRIRCANGYSTVIPSQQGIALNKLWISVATGTAEAHYKITKDGKINKK